MSDLVIFKNNQPVTTTLIIAEGSENSHESVIKLVRRYLPDLEEFGRVGFEILPFETAGGVQKREVAILNERQTTLLFTYMRNNAVVRRFKKQLVRQFYVMAERHAQPHQHNILAHEVIQQIPACIAAIKATFPSLGEASLQALAGDICEMDLGRRLIPSPTIQEPFYTATELAEEIGVSAHKIGRLANAFGLKTKEFGEFRLSKSKYSSKQVEQFHYNEKGRQALRLMLTETAEVN